MTVLTAYAIKVGKKVHLGKNFLHLFDVHLVILCFWPCKYYNGFFGNVHLWASQIDGKTYVLDIPCGLQSVLTTELWVPLVEKEMLAISRKEKGVLYFLEK